MRIEMQYPIVGMFVAAFVLVLVTATDARADYVTEVLADNPFVYFRLEESGVGHGTATANSGSGIDGTYGIDSVVNGSFTDVASPLWTGGLGKRLNGINDNQGAYVTSDQAAGFGALNEFTIEMLIRPEAFTSGIHALYATHNFNPGAVHFNLINGASAPAIELAVSGNPAPFPGSVSADLAIGEWTHVAATYETSGATSSTTIYVNGVAIAGPVVTGNGQAADFDTSGWFGIWFNGVNNRRFQGSIDELAIYSTALGSDDIARHFAAIAPTPAALPAGLMLMGITALRRRKRAA